MSSSRRWRGAAGGERTEHRERMRSRQAPAHQWPQEGTERGQRIEREWKLGIQDGECRDACQDPGHHGLTRRKERERQAAGRDFRGESPRLLSEEAHSSGQVFALRRSPPKARGAPGSWPRRARHVPVDTKGAPPGHLSVTTLSRAWSEEDQA